MSPKPFGLSLSRPGHRPRQPFDRLRVNGSGCVLVSRLSAPSAQPNPIPKTVRAELVEAGAQAAPALRRAQGERVGGVPVSCLSAPSAQPNPIPKTVRAEPVEAGAQAAQALRQTQGERVGVCAGQLPIRPSAQPNPIPKTVRAEPVEARAQAAQSLRQTQGERTQSHSMAISPFSPFSPLRAARCGPWTRAALPSHPAARRRRPARTAPLLRPCGPRLRA